MTPTGDRRARLGRRRGPAILAPVAILRQWSRFGPTAPLLAAAVGLAAALCLYPVFMLMRGSLEGWLAELRPAA